ncbi:MAG: hypothetical protein ACR2P0_02390 [Acidimicrobiales bacterium]
MIDPIIPELAAEGLLLQGAIAIDDLGEDVRTTLAESGFDLTGSTSLVLLGQVGGRLWKRHVSRRLDMPNPFDDVTVELVSTWIENAHPNALFSIVYPGPAPVPLGRLAERLGWGSPSPLGLTIHPEHGLWIAHRIAFLTDLAFSRPQTPGPHPCSTCADTPCVTACPVGAVSLNTGFDVEACSVHRIETGSGCAEQCFARNVCPVGGNNRYEPAQMRHHYASGLASIREWLEKSDEMPL